MNRKEKIRYLLSKKETRVALLEKDIYLFGVYYFTESFKCPSASFHKEWCKALAWDKHLLFIAFRESAKTFWAFVKFVHNIVYKKKRLQMFYCYDKKKSASRLFDVAIALQTNRKILNDFWPLFPGSIKNAEEQTQKKSIIEFITNNGVKCKAMSIGESPRGEIYIARDGSFRPDAIFLDDIDVDKSVSNVKVIEKNYVWIKGELLGGVSDNCQIIFLWNIIKEDGIVLRFEQDYKFSEDKWRIFRKAILEKGEITWPERYTQKDIDEKRNLLGDVSFNQNMLLIPYTGGESVIKREWVRTFNTFVGLKFDRITMGIDPAYSEKTFSDSFAIVVTATMGENSYVLEARELIGKEKDTDNVLDVCYFLYKKWNVGWANYESVTQEFIAKMLRSKWMAVRSIHPNKDKVARLVEHQVAFQTGKVFFYEKSEGVKKLMGQIVAFPNVIHDDLVDALVYSMAKPKYSAVV